ncbi:M10 family metallopeptidase C-terminal domain-containing protein [Allosphingosinicella sp.]|uniref:M10 family metallopeptidase C-terminal domain-containing protein n=1 Tax=Allosphingosinicella sp. TaxID=2823234 RepID=UPI002F16900E
MCDYDRATILQAWHEELAPAGWGASLIHFQKADTYSAYLTQDYTTAAQEGDPADPVTSGAAVEMVTGPDIPNDSSTNQNLTVDGVRIVSALEAPGDQDWFRVELTAGVAYEIGMYATRYGPTGVPLFDPLVEIRNSDGVLLRMDDSGGPDSTYHSDNALLLFTPETSGTYYVNARAWDARDPVGLTSRDPNPLTTTGDFVGDYEVFVRTSHLEPDYYPIRYETVDDPNTERDEIGLPTLDSSPLHAIDWQVQFDGSSRNPDGQEGPRPTGNPVENIIGGKNVIYYYFAREGEVFVDNAADPQNLTTTMVAKGMQEWERNAFEVALDRYEMVADIIYLETDDRWAADIVVITYQGTPGYRTPSLAGRMSPPDNASEGQTEFNAGDYRWTEAGLAPGGLYFDTLIHELGHGHGLAHPHDEGGGRASVMRGVVETAPLVFSTGDFDLNQDLYTMMSYNSGWTTSPYGRPASDSGYGFIGSLMAFDIAAIQDKYGVNEEWATGNDTYTIKDVNAHGTYYSSIWDAGGIDQIVYNGARDTTIDLRAATLKYEEGGGGWVSYAYGIHGGFTIANAVTIENASSGSGNDKLTGNDVGNVLSSGAGNDVIVGNGGNDLMDGGAGNDTMSGGTGDDIYYVDSGDTVIELPNEGWDSVYASGSFRLAAGSNVEVIATRNYALTDSLDLTGNEANNAITGNNGANALNGGGGDDTLNGLEGNDRLDGGSGRDSMVGGRGNDSYIVDNAGDRVTEAAGEGLDSVYASTSYTLAAGTEIEVLATVNYLSTDALALIGNEYNNAITGNEGANTLHGGGGGDTLRGLGGNDVLDGGAGRDSLEGGAGFDTFRFSSASDSAVGSIDRISDFLSGQDKIDLSAIDANSNTIANDAFTFIGSNAFTGVAGQLRAVQVNATLWQVQGDVNGDGVADLMIEVTAQSGLPILGSDFIP